MSFKISNASIGCTDLQMSEKRKRNKSSKAKKQQEQLAASYDESKEVTVASLDMNKYQRAKWNEEHYLPPLHRAAIIGSLLALFGLIVLGRSYITSINLWFVFSFDFAGAFLLGIGMLCMSIASHKQQSEKDDDDDSKSSSKNKRNRKEKGEEESEEEEADSEGEGESNGAAKFDFVSLNEKYSKQSKKAVRAVQDKLSSFSGDIQALFQAKIKEERQKQKEAKKQKEEEKKLAIKKQLDSGMSIREIIDNERKKVYVVRFDGDMKASAVTSLRQAVDLLIDITSKNDEVIIVLKSPGGMVPEYGLAAAQLLRLKQAGVFVSVCVDIVAASGGYMMASVANVIIASPFAYIGSIGVVAQVPNFHRILKKNEVDYMEFTAGHSKRTITVLGEVTDDKKQKFQQSLADIHTAFKEHVSSHRQQVSIEEIATGEFWLACQAKEKGLVDVLMTSDEYIQTKLADRIVIELVKKKYKKRKSWFKSLLGYFFQTSLSLAKKVPILNQFSSVLGSISGQDVISGNAEDLHNGPTMFVPSHMFPTASLE